MKEVDEYLEELKRLNHITARPAAKGFAPLYEAEIMFASGQWTLGKTFNDRAEAIKFAEEKCDEINKAVKDFCSELVIKRQLKKAKP
jgi:hypothetical protein